MQSESSSSGKKGRKTHQKSAPIRQKTKKKTTDLTWRGQSNVLAHGLIIRVHTVSGPISAVVRPAGEHIDQHLCGVSLAKSLMTRQLTLKGWACSPPCARHRTPLRMTIRSSFQSTLVPGMGERQAARWSSSDLKVFSTKNVGVS